MKMRIMKCSLLLLLIPFLAVAGPKSSEVEKRINREFSIATDGKLMISNKYGRIDVAIGESNKIKVEVVIKVEASSEKKAQERLALINVRFEEDKNRVSALTEIESSSGWMSWFETGNTEIQINYNVLVPADIYLDLINKYGSIYVETTTRDMRIDLDYGDIRLGDVYARLSLDMAYSNGAISRVNNGDIILAYSELEMEDAEAVRIDMKYADLVMGSAIRANVLTAYSDFRAIDIDELTYRGKYDDVSIERVKSIDYGKCVFRHEDRWVKSAWHFEMRYGDLQVSNIIPGFTRIDINTSYTGVVLRFAPVTSYAVDAQNNYCDIYHRNLKIMEDIQKAGSTTLKASKGTGGGLVFARMNYGSSAP
jgi:hypothetical protein